MITDTDIKQFNGEKLVELNDALLRRGLCRVKILEIAWNLEKFAKKLQTKPLEAKSEGITLETLKPLLDDLRVAEAKVAELIKALHGTGAGDVADALVSCRKCDMDDC